MVKSKLACGGEEGVWRRKDRRMLRCRCTCNGKIFVVVAIVLLRISSHASAATCGDSLREEGEQCEDGNQRPGDGCSPSCKCEDEPCRFTVSASVNLASVVEALAPGSGITLAAGTYGCGWRISSVNETDKRPITVRGAAQGTSIIDCNHFGPVVAGSVRGTHLRFEGLTFTNAVRSGSGGAVLRAEGGSHIVFDECRVTNCGADGDGGALLVANSSLLVSDSNFEENSAEGSGGSLAVVEGGRLTLTDSTFTRCFAGASGGAVYVTKASTLRMQGMFFSLNSAAAFGGSLFIYDRCTANVSTTVITNCTAVEGGAIRVESSTLLGIKSDVRYRFRVLRWLMFVYVGSYVCVFAPASVVCVCVCVCCVRFRVCGGESLRNAQK